MGMCTPATAISMLLKSDGVWLTFNASDGKTASLSIAALAEKRGGIVGAALRQWAADQIEAARHYHVAGGDIDACAKCGEDIRSPIHKRVGE